MELALVVFAVILVVLILIIMEDTHGDKKNTHL